MATNRRVPLVLAAVAVALLVAGLVVFLGGRDPVDFGWYAYSPLTEGGADPHFAGDVMWSYRQLLGAGIVVLGLVLGAGAAGCLLGRRHPSTG